LLRKFYNEFSTNFFGILSDQVKVIKEANT
jgi:hypothetical protein